jgi:hypothetical protein
MSSNTGSFRLLQNTQTWKGTVTKWLNRTKLKASVDIHNRVGADALWTHADGEGCPKVRFCVDVINGWPLTRFRGNLTAMTDESFYSSNSLDN